MSTAARPESPVFRGGDRHEVVRRRAQTRGRLLAYVTVRATGLMLAVLVLGHFALTHITTDVADADAAFIARRWASALWVAWDWLMLASALVHGAAGVWIAIEDYTTETSRRGRRQVALVAISAVLLMLGTVALVVAAA
jgi:succinate dehydrogenase hydrophobic anchor subunit